MRCLLRNLRWHQHAGGGGHARLQHMPCSRAGSTGQHHRALGAISPQLEQSANGGVEQWRLTASQWRWQAGYSAAQGAGSSWHMPQGGRVSPVHPQDAPAGGSSVAGGGVAVASLAKKPGESRTAAGGGPAVGLGALRPASAQYPPWPWHDGSAASASRNSAAPRTPRAVACMLFGVFGWFLHSVSDSSDFGPADPGGTQSGCARCETSFIHSFIRPGCIHWRLALPFLVFGNAEETAAGGGALGAEEDAAEEEGSTGAGAVAAAALLAKDTAEAVCGAAAAAAASPSPASVPSVSWRILRRLTSAASVKSLSRRTPWRVLNWNTSSVSATADDVRLRMSLTVSDGGKRWQRRRRGTAGVRRTAARRRPPRRTNLRCAEWPARRAWPASPTGPRARPSCPSPRGG